MPQIINGKRSSNSVLQNKLIEELINNGYKTLKLSDRQFKHDEDISSDSKSDCNTRSVTQEFVEEENCFVVDADYHLMNASSRESEVKIGCNSIYEEMDHNIPVIKTNKMQPSHCSKPKQELQASPSALDGVFKETQ